MPNMSSIGGGLWPGLPKPQVTCITLCREGLCIATGTADGSIWLWRTPHEWRTSPKVASRDEGHCREGERVRPLAVLCGQHETSIAALVTAVEGKQRVLLSADSSGRMCVWRVEDGVCLKTSHVLSWGPRTIVNVSCKGKSLIACCGPSPDIEVIDVGSMKRIVRLFGHGDWCTDLCVRPREALMDLDLQSNQEPSIYSLDRGGTLCVWLAERTCPARMVGWIPSVQCHRVAVSCPTSLALDKNCEVLMVVGRDAAAHYRLGRDHRFVDKSELPTIFTFAPSRSTPAADAADWPTAESPSTASSLSGHQPEAKGGKGPETAAQRRAKWLAGSQASNMTGQRQAERVAGGQWHLFARNSRDLSKTRGVLAPGGDRALVWQPHEAILLLRTCKETADEREHCTRASDAEATSPLHESPPLGDCAATEVNRLAWHAAMQIVALSGDVWGWWAAASESGDVYVWSADASDRAGEGPGLGVESVAPHLSAASALRSRYASDCELMAVTTTCVGETVAAGEEMAPSRSVDGKQSQERSQGPVRRATTGYEILTRDWTFRGNGWLLEAFYAGEHVERDLTAASAAAEEAWELRCQGACRAGPNGEQMNAVQAEQMPSLVAGRAGDLTATVSIVHVEGSLPMRRSWGGEIEPAIGSDGRRRARTVRSDESGGNRCRTQNGVYWVVGYSSGLVRVVVIPTMRTLLFLGAGKEVGGGHRASVSALLWVHGEDILVSGDAGGDILVWDMPGGEMRCRFTHTTSPVERLLDLGVVVDVHLRHECVLFALAADGSILVFAAKGGLDGLDSGPVRESGDGAGGSRSSSAKAKRLFLLGCHNQEVVNVFWSAQHHFLYAQTRHGYLFAWLLNAGELAQLVRQMPLLGAEVILQALESRPRATLQHWDGELAKEAGDFRCPPLAKGVNDGGGASGSGGGEWGGGIAAEDVEAEDLMPVDDRIVALSHHGPGGDIPRAVVGVAMLRCDALVALMQRDFSAQTLTNSSASLPRASVGASERSDEGRSDLKSSDPPQSPGATGGRPRSCAGPLQRNDSLFPSSANRKTNEEMEGRNGQGPLLWEALGGETSLLALALSIVIGNLAPGLRSRCWSSLDAKEEGSNDGPRGGVCLLLAQRVCNALKAVGFVELQGAMAQTGEQEMSGWGLDLHLSCVLNGAGRGITLIVPSRSSTFSVCQISPFVSGALSICCAMLLDSCRCVTQARGLKGVDIIAALLQFVSKEMAGRVPRFREPDVIGLAHHWLTTAERSRSAAYTLLMSRLSRMDAATLKSIVEGQSLHLRSAPQAKGGGSRERTEAGGGVTVVDAKSPGGRAEGSRDGSGAKPEDCFKGEDGVAVAVLAVIGSYFPDCALHHATAERVARGLVRAVSSGTAQHARLASNLLARGAAIWSRYLKNDAVALFRVLYARYWRYGDFGTSLSDAETALRSLAPMLPAEFVEVLAEEAGRHSQLVCNVRSDRTVMAIRVLVAILKRHPVQMLPALPRAVEVILNTLDPAHPHVRQALLANSTSALKEIVRRFPQTAFHQTTQRFAVGTVDALVVIFDVRTATKWRVLEGHEGPIDAVAFDSAGQRLATFSANEGRVRYWETGSSGPFGLFSNKVGRCVQQFTLLHSHTHPAAEQDKRGEATDVSFGVLFTPTAIVLTRNQHPIAEFSIQK